MGNTFPGLTISRKRLRRLLQMLFAQVRFAPHNYNAGLDDISYGNRLWDIDGFTLKSSNTETSYLKDLWALLANNFVAYSQHDF